MFTMVKSTSKYTLENSVTFLRWWMSSVIVRQMSVFRKIENCNRFTKDVHAPLLQGHGSATTTTLSLSGTMVGAAATATLSNALSNALFNALVEIATVCRGRRAAFGPRRQSFR